MEPVPDHHRQVKPIAGLRRTTAMTILAVLFVLVEGLMFELMRGRAPELPASQQPGGALLDPCG